MRRFLAIISVLLYTYAAFAGQDSFVKRIDTSHGLSHPSITDVLTDSDGTIWIGTRYLLNRYVNSSLVTYDESQISGTYINFLFEDRSRNLWVSTEAGLSRYDKNSDSFILVHSGEFYSAAESGNKVCFGGRSKVLLLDKETGEMLTAPTQANHILGCIPVSEGKVLLVDKFSGLYSFDIETLVIERVVIPELNGVNILSSCKSDEGIWLGVYFKGLYLIDSEGRILERHLLSEYPDIRLEVLCDIAEIDGTIWLGTDGSGVCTLQNGRITPYESVELPSAITCIYGDNYSNIWAGSVRDGLSGIKSASIRNYPDFGPAGQATPVILSLCHDDKYIWIGTDGEGIYRYDPEDDSFFLLPRTAGNIFPSVSDADPDHLLADMYFKGLCLIDKRSGSIQPLTIVDTSTNRSEITSGYTINLCNLHDGRTLVEGENVYIYDHSTRGFQVLLSDFGVDPSELHPFHTSPDGKTAYAFSHTAIYAIDLVRNRVALLYSPENCGRINTAACTSGMIWIGTDSGMLSFDMLTRKVETIESGLFRRVTTLAARGANSVWIAANNTLFSYDSTSGLFEIYDEAEGFTAGEVMASDTRDSLFFFGGPSGLTVVPADLSRTVSLNPVLALSKVSVDGSALRIRPGRRLRMPSSMNTASFSFNLSGGDPFRRTLLKYTIDGRSDVNVETYNTTFTIQKIQSGDYTLKVSYLRTDGIWSEEHDYLRFTVPDVLWKRDWFICLMLVLLCAVLYFVALKIRDKADEELQTAISRNKADDVKRRSRFVKGIGAEIHGPLAEISSSAHHILNNENDLSEKSRNKLESIFSNSLQIERALSDAIEQEEPVDSENDLLSKFAHFIDEHISDSNLDVSLLVREMGMSRTVLYEKVKEMTGMGINEYIQKRRLIMARKYLVETDMSISEIADTVGFSSPKYFSVVFKNAFDVSPREFKKRITDSLI